MTDTVAKSIFDILLSGIRTQGFTGIGGFAIEGVSQRTEFGQFNEDYKYESSDAALYALEILSTRPQGGVTALSRLLDASIEYFSLASRIPKRFQEEIDSLADTGKADMGNYAILLNTALDTEVNISLRLQDPSVKEIIDLLNLIRSILNEDDDFILKALNES